MIVEIDKAQIELINQLENTFSTIFSSKNRILSDFDTNIFTKYFIYMEKSNIIAYVNYYDLYDRFELAYIYVDEKYRNQKIGSQMVEYLINMGKNKNINNITLEVRIDNFPAIKLYEKYKFNKVAVRKNYYDGIDGYLMERKMM